MKPQREKVKQTHWPLWKNTMMEHFLGIRLADISVVIYKRLQELKSSGLKTMIDVEKYKYIWKCMHI